MKNQTLNYAQLTGYRIAICTSSCEWGGRTKSISILYDGFKKFGWLPVIIITSRDKGNFFNEMQQAGYNIKAVAPGKIWLKERMKLTYNEIKNFDVVINNHSEEVWLLTPVLPKELFLLSVIRGVTKQNINQALFNSQYLDALVGVSPAVTEQLEVRAKCKVFLIPNSVRTKLNGFKKLNKIIRIGFLGRLTQSDKNIFILPKIVKALDDSRIDFEFLVIGDGVDSGRLKKRFIKNGMLHRVNFVGSLDYQAAEEMLRSLDFMVMPSNHESFGLSLVEAMAVGVIPITSGLPAFTWILGNEAGKLQVKDGNARKYVDVISRIISDNNEFTLLQKRLHDNQQSRFVPEITVSQFLVLINNLVQSRNIRPFKAKLPLFYRLRCTVFYYRLQKFWNDHKGKCGIGKQLRG